tara:strand:+ start:175 stop:312 length:138 start_codon:yes stop_codon:yes gene_type:complete
MNHLLYVPDLLAENCVMCGKPMDDETYHKQGGYCSSSCLTTDIEL